MPEEPRPESAPAPKSGGIMKLIVPVVIVVVAVAGALALYQFVVKPRLGSEPPKETKEESTIPLEAVDVEFEDFTTNAKLAAGEEGPAVIFMYKISLECSNPEVALVVEENKARFRDIIGRIHEFRTRDELNDPLLKNSIKAQVLQEANQALNELMRDKAGPENRITNVFYEKWFVYDRVQ